MAFLAGVFAPTVFSKIFGSLKCLGCERIHDDFVIHEPKSLEAVTINNATGFLCQQCEQSLVSHKT